MKAMAYAMAILACGSPGALAQTPATPAPGEVQGATSSNVTRLHLSAEGVVSVPPDVLVGELVAQATSPSAAEAQGKVNAMMAQGMKDARAVEGLEIRAMDYAVNQVDLDSGVTPTQPHPRRMGWMARQTLEVRGKDGERLLVLVGKLQDEGLAAASLDWQVSPALGRKARDDAIVAALQALRVRAGNAARALDLQVDHLQEVRVDLPGPEPVRPMMAMRAMAVAAPQATAMPQDVAVMVSADIALRP